MKTPSTDRYKYRKAPTKNRNTHTDVGWYALAAAIVKQAVDEYRDCERLIKGEIKTSNISELIDRKALLDECLNHYEVGNIEQNCTMDWICKTVRNFPTASPWHRVEDGMPDLLQFVVVCNDEGKCVVAQYVGYQTDSLTPWRIAYIMYDTDAYYEMENGPVRYWMLIEPPKEGV